jgi:hypothetical protein
MTRARPRRTCCAARWPPCLLRPGLPLAAAMAAWLHQLTATALGKDIVHGHGAYGGKAMIATLRRRLIAVPGGLTRQARHLILRLPPGHGLLHEISARLRALPAPADLRFLTPAPRPRPRPARPGPQKGPADREPGAVPGPSACPPPGIPAHQDHLQRQGSAYRTIRGFGSDKMTAVIMSGESPSRPSSSSPSTKES